MFCYLLMEDLKNARNVVFKTCYSMCFCWLIAFIKRREQLICFCDWKEFKVEISVVYIESFPFLIDQYQVCSLWSINLNLETTLLVDWYVGACSLLTYTYRFPLAKRWCLKRTIEYAHFYTIYIIPLLSETVSFLVDQSYRWSCYGQ